MPYPLNNTSAESLVHFPAGEIVERYQQGPWHHIKLSIFHLNQDAARFWMPSISEPMVVWVMSGNANIREREEGSSEWFETHVGQGSLFITAAGAPYEFEWRRKGSEPFKVMLATLSLEIFEQAANKTFGKEASRHALMDVSGIHDASLVQQLNLLYSETQREVPRAGFIDLMSQALALHLATDYLKPDERPQPNYRLPRFKLKRVINWMESNLATAFSLDEVAAVADMSSFHFNRLFKESTGLPPSQFHIKLRLAEAKRLLRESDQSVTEIALKVGYNNPSHFAQRIKRETGLSPREYRKQK